MDDDERLSRRTAFDEDAASYAAHRPTYPAALFDRLAEFGGLGPGARVLEIGPGTGQATRSLAERGWSVTAVELGARMAAEARRHLVGLPSARVVVAPFEEWPLPAEPFDAVVCATAFHLLDPRFRAQRVADALRPGGVVAIVSTRHVRGGTQAVFDAAQRCYLRHVPGTDPEFRLPDEGTVTPRAEELAASDRFDEITCAGFPVEVGYDAAGYVALLATYSDVRRLPERQRAGLLACLQELVDREFGGHLVVRTVFELVLARRAPDLCRAGRR